MPIRSRSLLPSRVTGLLWRLLLDDADMRCGRAPTAHFFRACARNSASNTCGGNGTNQCLRARKRPLSRTQRLRLLRPLPDLASRLRSAFGLQAASARTEDENRDDELRRLREVAAKWGTTPILDEEDLKYEGMLTLDDRDKPVLDWVKRNAADRLCIRVRRSGGNTLAWVITNDPGSAEVAAVCSLLDLKGWEVRVRPATRRVVERAVVRDQALTPTEVEEKFRDLVSDALDADASDIHFEVRGDNGNTRFRVNGEMQDVTREDQQPRFTRPVIEQFGNYMFKPLGEAGLPAIRHQHGVERLGADESARPGGGAALQHRAGHPRRGHIRARVASRPAGPCAG